MTPKEIERLSIWKFNARKWRESNGLTSQEWIDYKEWHQFRSMVTAMTMYLIGVAAGVSGLVLFW